MNYWIWLATVEGLGPVKKQKLLATFQTAEGIYHALREDILKVEGMTEKIYLAMEHNKQNTLLSQYEEYLQKNGIKMIHIVDEAYPEKLRQIASPPTTLFCIGDVSLLQSISIGMVGTREASSYGLKIARSFGKELSEAGLTVVSGMARGIDTASHLGALEGTKKTIAVLGNGVDIVYPKENTFLYNEIAQYGLLVSEYIVGTTPEPGNFPARNRIISGLSSGVLVVEAKKESGTMITTDFALEQGREIYVIPGNITSPNSEGTNNLLKEGAKLVTCVKDILEDF